MIAAALLLIAVGTWWLAYRVAPPVATSDGAVVTTSPDYVIENFTLSVKDKRGREKYQLSAVRLEHYPQEQGSHLTRPDLTQFPAGAAPARTRSDRAFLPDDESHIVMTGNVRATRGADTRSAGGTMATEKLRIELAQ